MTLITQRYLQIQNQHQQALQGYQQSQQAYQRAFANRALYERYLSRYIDFKDKGYIGSEQRIDWVEQLQSFSADYQLSYLRYDITPRERIKALSLDQQTIQPQATRLYQSSMQINLGLLHELDLVDLFTQLDQQAKGLYHIQDCYLTSGTLLTSTPQARQPLNAQCRLNWYTLQP